MARQTELERLTEEREAWLAEYADPRDLSCPRCAATIGALFYITWAEQPVMDAMADGSLGGVPTQGFYVLVSQEGGALTPLRGGGRRRYGRAKANGALPPAWVGLPGEVTCAACGELAQIPHPRFAEQARLDKLKDEAGLRRRWRRG